MTHATLADVGTSAAAAVGVPGFADVLGIGPCRHVIVCLIDGLGWNALQAHRDRAPTLISLAGRPISAPFPSTTPVGLGSLGTGLLPGMHGLVGASFVLPETDRLLIPLHWGDDPNPIVVQPETTVFEAVARSGVTMATVSPAAYRNSGLTRAVLRGGAYSAAEDVAARVEAVREQVASSLRTYTYVYWPELDRIGHEFGVGSVAWADSLARADDLVQRMISDLPSGTAVVVTADHGMVDCPVDRRVAIEDSPILMNGIERVAGEPRARHLYVAPGAALDVQAAWRHELSDRAEIVLRSEITDRGLMGPMDPVIADRIGDVMAIAVGDTLLASRVDSTVSALLGQHGALSPDELLIPLLTHRVG